MLQHRGVGAVSAFGASTPMSSEHVLGKEASASSDEQTSEECAVPNRPELRATVELESQAKVDTNHPDATPEGMTLAGEEKFAAREAEIRATRQRADDRQQSSREARSRRVASQGSEQRRRTFQKRAASVVPSQGPDDPRELLERDVVAEINQHADRLVTQLQGWSRAAIARRGRSCRSRHSRRSTGPK